MKKRTIISMILAAVILGTVLTGCGSKDSGSQKEEAAATEETKPEETASTELANPWSDVASAEEAAKGAGLDSFVIAEDLGLDLGELFETTYRCMDGIAQARLEFPASAITIRKGTAAEDGDISGDYTEYKNTWTLDVGGIEVTCFGNREGDATKAIWAKDNVYYSEVSEGLGGDDDFGLSAERLTNVVNGVQ